MFYMQIRCDKSDEEGSAFLIGGDNMDKLNIDFRKTEMMNEIEDQKREQIRNLEKFANELQKGKFDDESYNAMKHCQLAIKVIETYAMPKKSPLEFLSMFKKKEKEVSFG